MCQEATPTSRAVRSRSAGGELAGGFATVLMMGSNTITCSLLALCAGSVLFDLLRTNNIADSGGSFVITWVTAPYGDKERQ